MKKYKIIAAIAIFYFVLITAVFVINSNRTVAMQGARRMIAFDYSIPNPVGDFMIGFAVVSIVIGIVAWIVYEIVDSIKRRREKKAEREKELRK